MQIKDHYATEVSIHAPAWGATMPIHIPEMAYKMFQSTHPHGVRRNGILHNRDTDKVSIHAPAWGATL